MRNFALKRNNMEGQIFKRKIYDAMLRWKHDSAGSTALMIEGPRRVGKSTIVRQFAQREYKSYIMIDFSKASDEEKGVFNNLSNIDFFFATLKLIEGTALYERESVIIFDEVQLFPVARQAIKHLVADGRYDYIETGSLISIHKNVESIVIPSEEEPINMYPMDYEEFRWAMGDVATMPLLKEMYQKRQSLGDGVNRKLMLDFRLYMLVGGMPQAVNTYLQTHDFSQVDKTKRGIIRLYLQDFNKLDPNERATTLFNAIPAQLYKNSSRYQPTQVLENTNNERLAPILHMMEESKTVNIAWHADDPHVGMGLTTNRGAYKMYVCDTGLFVTLAFWEKDFTDNIIYKKLLSDKLDANLGYVYENIVAQMLAASGNKLYYYTWPAPKNHFYEIDFLLSRGSKLCPVEVKSSGYNTHTSLDEFCKKYSNRVKERYLVYTKDLRTDKETMLVPMYMVPFL